MPVQTRSQSKVVKANKTLSFVQTRSQTKALKMIVVEKPIVVEKTSLATLATDQELLELGLTPNSADPSGKYRIVVNATELEFVHVCAITGNYGREALHNKWAIAPQGYYWKYFSQKCYYSFDWYELRAIPV